MFFKASNQFLKSSLICSFLDSFYSDPNALIDFSVV